MFLFFLFLFFMFLLFLFRLPESDVEWLTNHTKHDRQEVLEMFDGFRNDFKGGLELDQFTALFPDLNSGIATANLVFR